MLEIEEIESIEKSIKSSYNLKEIFCFVNQRRTLKLIIYNKNIQKKLKVNIVDYKNASGKYKVGRRNGKGSEYTQNTNILIFEGEYMVFKWKKKWKRQKIL